jgi:hypothetical protein
MRWYVFLGVLGIALTAANIALAQSAATKIAPQKGWLTDLAAARTLAQKTGKPLMIVFRCDP